MILFQGKINAHLKATLKTKHQKVYLIRHAQTSWSEAGKHTGLTDLPLTDAGRIQAKALAAPLKDQSFKAIFCSPLERAKETCRLAGLFNEANIDEDLDEWDYGNYEGMTTKEIHELDPNWSIFKDGAPDGESVGDVSSRAQRMIGKIQGIQGDVAIFSSGHFTRVLAAKWLHLPAGEGRLFTLSTASISILGYEHEMPAMLKWNQTDFGAIMPQNQ